jgi:hypothetical protein
MDPLMSRNKIAAIRNAVTSPLIARLLPFGGEKSVFILEIILVHTFRWQNSLIYDE